MREQTRLAKLAVLGLTAASLAAWSSYPLGQPSAGATLDTPSQAHILVTG